MLHKPFMPDKWGEITSSALLAVFALMEHTI